jgi:glutathione S-transferase
MIDLYYWTTPNGHKVTMFLEEAGVPYRIVPVNISTGEQFKPDFLKISRWRDRMLDLFGGLARSSPAYDA